MFAVAVRMQAAAMQLGQPLDECQPEPQAAGVPRVRVVCLTKRIEQIRHKGRRDTTAVVAHHDARHLAH